MPNESAHLTFRALDEFITAAIRLDNHFDNDLLTSGYPFAKDFDEIVNDLERWRAIVTTKLPNDWWACQHVAVTDEAGESFSCHVAEFLRDNEDLADEILALSPGASITIGGGAAPMFVVTREAPRSGG